MKKLPEMCVLFHGSTHELSGRFLREMRRNYYVTPTSYLELLQTYKSLLGRRQSEVMTVMKRCVCACRGPPPWLSLILCCPRTTWGGEVQSYHHA